MIDTHPKRSWLVRAVTSGRFGVLFWLLVLAIALPVLVPDGPVIRRGMAVVLFVVMLSGLNAISNHRRELLVGILIAVPAVAMNWAGIGLDHFRLFLISQLLYLVFFAYLAILTLRWTLQQYEVDVDTIYGAVSVYLLMALAWGLAYYALVLSTPGSLHYPAEDMLSEVQRARVDGSYPAPAGVAAGEWRDLAESAQGTLMYYSFVTLTTLGYGDVYPVSDTARILAMLEATLGQLYLVILVARLVGLYTAQETERRRKATPT